MKSVTRQQRAAAARPRARLPTRLMCFSNSVTFLDTKNYRVSSVVLPSVHRRYFSWVFRARVSTQRLAERWILPSLYTPVLYFPSTRKLLTRNIVIINKELFPFAQKRNDFTSRPGFCCTSFPAGVVAEGNAGLCLTPGILMSCCVTNQENVSTTKSEIGHPTLQVWI